MEKEHVLSQPLPFFSLFLPFLHGIERGQYTRNPRTDGLPLFSLLPFFPHAWNKMGGGAVIIAERTVPQSFCPLFLSFLLPPSLFLFFSRRARRQGGRSGNGSTGWAWIAGTVGPRVLFFSSFFFPPFSFSFPPGVAIEGKVDGVGDDSDDGERHALSSTHHSPPPSPSLLRKERRCKLRILGWRKVGQVWPDAVPTPPSFSPLFFQLGCFLPFFPFPFLFLFRLRRVREIGRKE